MKRRHAPYSPRISPLRFLRFLRCSLLPLLCVVSGSACVSSFEPAAWHETPPLARPRDQVFQAVVDALQREGFEVGERDDARGTLTTRWRVWLRPVWREGRRERVTARIENAPGGKFIVKLSTPREINENSRNPMSATEAKWEAGGGNEEFSQRLTYILRMKLAGLSMDD